MKILVINGSPKAEASNTMHATRAFLAGMNEAAPQETEVIHLIDQRIGFCRGCFSCWKNEGKCIQNDDMRLILEKIPDFELLLFSFPLLCHGRPALLQLFYERMLPLSRVESEKFGEQYDHLDRMDFTRLRYLMICGLGFPVISHNAEPAIEQFKLAFPEDHTILMVPESLLFHSPELEAVTRPRLELIRQAGAQYGATGSIESTLTEAILSPMIPEEKYISMLPELIE